MFKTLIGKFSFFFWLIFLISNILIYFFGTIYIKNILTNSEQEKISLMLNTIKPAIAFDISFNQEEQLSQLLDNLLQYNGVKKVKIHYANQSKVLKTKKAHHLEKLFVYNTSVTDPFTRQIIATITIAYSNENINNLQNKILLIQLNIFLFTLVLFLLFFLYVKRDLKALITISNSLLKYSTSRAIEPINLKNTSKEIETIANIANEMMSHISQYVKELKTFNAKLEKQVEIKIEKEKKQDKMMIHQSRQAAMGEILESIAHQWRQPLNNISISVADIQLKAMLDTIDNATLIKKLQAITLNTNYMSDTIDDFRNFLSPDSKKVLFNPLNSIREVFTILNAQLKSKHIDYTIEQKSKIEFLGTENEFKQVILVLINNAKDAILSKIKEKKITSGKIHVCLYQDNKYNFIDIKDNGTGIKDEIITSIFEPYFTTKFAAQGTGIGLYMAKNIISSRMEGSLSVKNLNEGCCFTIKIPKIIHKDQPA